MESGTRPCDIVTMSTSPPTTGLVELHRHLDGSLRPRTVAHLAHLAGVPMPPRIGFTAGMGLHEALAQFRFTVALLQSAEALRRVAAEMCEDAAAEGIDTLEIRFAPQLHGIGVPAAVDAVLEGIDGRAGLLLCGLYGEDPEVLIEHVIVARSRPGVVGIDLAGGPASGHEFRLLDYARPFAMARQFGLGRTVHAGEGRPPAEIRTAIEALHAQRIGHGTTLLQDPAVRDLVIDRGVTIEACPTSNVHTGVIAAVADHPLADWLAAGVRCTVCTDNTLLSAVTMPEELDRVRAIAGIDDAAIARLIANGKAAHFERPGRAAA